jgi:hypothetical protein
MSEFMKCAICHEAGHIVVAHNLGIAVQCVRVAGRLTITDVQMRDLDSPSRARLEKYIFLAGGIAGEQFVLGDYDREGMQDDQNKITQRGGGPIDDYLPKALSILETSKSCIDRIRQAMTLNWASARAEAQVSSDPDSYEVLSRVQLMHILQGC